MRSLSRLSIFVCVVAATSFAAMGTVQAGPHCAAGAPEGHGDHAEHAARNAEKEEACPHAEKAKGEMPEECGEKLGGLIDGLKSVQRAIEQGDTEEASAKLAAAIERLEGVQQAAASATGTPLNTECPIMGGRVVPEDTDADLTREVGGKTVGFCCAGCPDQWDELSEEEAREKLQEVVQQCH